MPCFTTNLPNMWRLCWILPINMVTSWIMIMDLINEMHILRWHLKTNIVVLFTLPMIPLFILVDSDLHVIFIQIYAFKHEPSTVQPNLPPCVVALPAFAASRRRNCAFLARQPRTMASARQPLGCCLVTIRIPWNMKLVIRERQIPMTQPFTHFATNQHPGAFQCVTYNSRQHSPFTSRVTIEAVYYIHPHIRNFFQPSKRFHSYLPYLFIPNGGDSDPDPDL